MRDITLGSTGITVPQNAFGALPLQRLEEAEAVALLRVAHEGGMRYFDTARAYSNSEHRVGLAFEGRRDDVYLATKTMARTPDAFWADLETSLSELRTDYIDVHQFHCVDQAYAPGDGTGMYECMLEAKRQGKIRHIGVTAHKIEVAFDCVRSGLYEVLQFPLSYLSGERERELIDECRAANVGYVAMKGLAGGLITNSRAAMAYLMQFDNVLPIWGVQRMSELREWLAYMDETPQMDDELAAFIENERAELAGDFCRGCGYCMPCPAGIKINDCARMSLLLRRSPGREAYPGDVFYLHSRLLERAARVNAEYVERFTKGEVKGKTGSMTALPIIETQAGDVTAFVPTNVISITDGQIFLETDLFNAGIRPAINPGISVSRVGGAAQTKIIKKLGGGVRLALAQYRELAAFAQFASDLDETTRKELERGRVVTELMKQPQYRPLQVWEEALVLFSVNIGFYDNVAVKDALRVERAMRDFMQEHHADLVDRIEDKKVLDKDDAAALEAAVNEFKKNGAF